jgi:hypothetical protein
MRQYGATEQLGLHCQSNASVRNPNISFELSLTENKTNSHFQLPAFPQAIHQKETKIGMVDNVQARYQQVCSVSFRCLKECLTHEYVRYNVHVLFYSIVFENNFSCSRTTRMKNRFSWLMARNACLEVRKCLLEVRLKITQNRGRVILKTPNFGLCSAGILFEEKSLST